MGTRHSRIIVVRGPAAAALLLLLAAGLAGVGGSSVAASPEGLVVLRCGASPGYTLFAPDRLRSTYLVDLDGAVLHSWDHRSRPGQSQYLLANGDLLRAGELKRGERFQRGKGGGGVVEQLTWDGELVWRLVYSNDEHRQHHDIERLPNGNVLLIAWEHLGRREAIALGRRSDLLSDGELWPDTIVEVDPDTNRVVWKWRVRDHLVQDVDPTVPSYGTPAEHRGRIDINYTLGDHGGRDWNHINSVAYDARLDQIVLSVRQFSEIWVIDHATTTEEARGPAGDLLFRYGNPSAYGRGSEADQELYTQHDARWQRDQHGAVHFLVLNNGQKSKREYTSVDEIHPRMVGETYLIGEDGRFSGRLSRVYPEGDGGTDRFFAFNTSGAQRLPNDNVLVTDGPHGRIFEVTSNGRVVWDYVNPYFDRRNDEPSRSGSGYVIDPWRIFRADRYPPDHPGVRALARRAVPPASGSGEAPNRACGRDPDAAGLDHMSRCVRRSAATACGDPFTSTKR